MDTIPSGKRLTLHLGVIVQPYRARGKKSAAVDTGQVAQWMEDKYGLFSVFARAHEQDIAGSMEGSLQGALESMMMGAPKADPFASAMTLIENSFRQFIASKEAERVGIPGTPTQAALNGVNHRLRHPYAKANPRRPSFLDTGLLMTSFKAWTD